MNERWLVSSFTASSLIHLGIIPLAALVMHAKPIKPAMVPIELVDVPRVEEPKRIEVAPPPPPPKPKNITAPKLLSKPVLETRPLPPPKEEIKEKPVEPPLPDTSGSAKAGWNVGSKAAEAKAAPRAPATFLAAAAAAWWVAAVSKAAAAEKEQPGWGEALKATAPAGTRFRAWLGLSAVIRSSRAIRSRRAERACRA